MFKLANRTLFAACASAVLAGCTLPSATIDLIRVAQKGLADERQAVEATHDQLIEQLEGRQASLDAAFDADVRLAAGGQIEDPKGNPVALSPEWIISARKGYIAARDAIGGELVNVELVRQSRLDNLHAMQEALSMATDLVIRQSLLAENVKQYLSRIHRRLTGGNETD